MVVVVTDAVQGGHGWTTYHFDRSAQLRPLLFEDRHLHQRRHVGGGAVVEAFHREVVRWDEGVCDKVVVRLPHDLWCAS